MLHEHIFDSDLATYAASPEVLSPRRRAEIEQALDSCPQCRTSAEFLAIVGTEDWSYVGISTESEWNDSLRAYSERIAAEDDEADRAIAHFGLFTLPSKTAWTNLQRNKRLLTGGVVRRLNARAHDVHLDRPIEALIFADSAISIAEALPDDSYPFNAVYELRGTAWKERANALVVKGDYPEALLSLTHAERAYGRLRSSGFGLSTVALLRASVFYQQGLLDRAASSAQIAEQGFANLGQEERRTRAIFLRALVKFEACDFLGAVPLFKQVLEYGETSNNPRWIARAAYATGNCALDTGNAEDASMHFHRALIIFREIGPAWDRLATEWGIARIVMQGGNLREACRRSVDIAAEYESHGMLSDAALVRLDVAEALLVLGEAREIVELAGRLFRAFKAAGMMRSALTAIAYMKEAASSGKLTPAAVDAVRAFL